MTAGDEPGGAPSPGARSADAPDPELAEVYQLILDRAPEHDVIPTLTRIRLLCDMLGEPQKAFRVVHVSGTNGKTSTTRIIERLLREHGLRTGRFTSPHLSDVRERIAVDGEPLPADRFVEAFHELEPYLDLVDSRSVERGEPRLSFFEVLVAMAYSVFADAPVDVAVVEVGMGGAWDATNVADGEVAVITPIALDHERFLGAAVETIAAEKAGIIKRGAAAVIGQQPAEAAEALLHRSTEVQAHLAWEGIEFGVLERALAVGGQQIAVQGLAGSYPELYLPLHGSHQAHNAACAIAAVETFLGAQPEHGGLDVEVLRAGLLAVDSPGRLEIVRRSPTVLVDAAHNPAGAAALAEALGESFTFTRLVGLVAVLADKDAAGILEALEPALDDVVVTRTSSGRSMPVSELAEIAADVFGDHRVHIADNLVTAIDVATGLAEERQQAGGGVVATGSVTMAADVRLLLGRA